MEILHVCPSQSFSGLEQYALALATDQKKRGLDVAFVVCPDTQLEKECEARGIPVIGFNPYKIFGMALFWRKLNRLIGDQGKLKVIHIHSTQEVLHVWG